MIKTSPTPFQILAMAMFALCSFAAMLFLWLAIAGAGCISVDRFLERRTA